MLIYATAVIRCISFIFVQVKHSEFLTIPKAVVHRSHSQSLSGVWEMQQVSVASHQTW